MRVSYTEIYVLIVRGIPLYNKLNLLYSEGDKTMDKTLDWQIIGRNLSFFRFISQISREDLATRLGMSVQQLSRLEKGMEEFTINLVVTAALALGTQP